MIKSIKSLALIAAGIFSPKLLLASDFYNQVNEPQTRSDIKFEVDPLAAAFGSYSLGLGIGVTNKLILGVNGSRTPKGNLGADKYFQSYGGGIYLEYFFENSRSNSYYTKIEIHHDIGKIGINDYKLRDSDESTINVTANSLNIMGGYQWFWQNGMSVGLAGGLRVIQFRPLKGKYRFEKKEGNVSSNLEFRTSHISNTEASLELSVGYMI